MIMRSDVGKDRENRPILYTVILGNPAVLSIVDLNTGKVVKSLPLPETSGAWGVKVSTDNTVYLGAYNKGLLYRYSPETGELKNLGHPIKSQDAVLYPMDAMPDGKIYGGTYPSGHAYEFDLGEGEMDPGDGGGPEKQ
jgi:outer membrane protein assembly factor BamB